MGKLTHSTHGAFSLYGLACVPFAMASLCAHAEESTVHLGEITIVGEQQTYFSDENTTALKVSAYDGETPFVISSTNQTFMTDIRADNLEDIFSYTVGVNRSAKVADGFVIRGFDTDLNNIKVDGMSGLTTRFGSPSTANIEKVEVLKGPASVLYGNMDAGGMVNLITKKPQETFAASVTTGIETFASKHSNFGSDNGLFTTIDLTGPVASRDDLFYRLILTGDRTESFRGDVVNKEYYAYGDLLWQINDTAELSLGLEVGKQTGDADDGLVALNNDIKQVADIDTYYQNEGSLDEDEGTSFTLGYNQLLPNGEFNLNWRSVLHEDQRKLYENNRVNDADETLRRRLRHQKNTRDWHSLDTYLVQHATTGTLEHEWTLGASAEYRLTDYDRINWGGFDTVDVYNPTLGGTVTAAEGNRRKTQYYSYGVYAQDKVQVTDALTLVGSLRHNQTRIDYRCERGSCNDNNTTSTSDNVGSLGAVYALNEDWTVFASLAQSFDPYTAERVDINGNALKAEESIQYEGGLRYQAGDQVNVSLSAYEIHKENVSESLGGGAYETIGEVKSQGAELDIQWLPTANWQIKAGYAYNDSEVTEGANKGLTSAHAPRNTLFVFTRYNQPNLVFGGELGMTLGVTYRDEVKTNTSSASAVILPDYVVTDAGLHFEKGDWQTSLGITNLFDKTYYHSGRNDTNLYVGDPRKVTLSVTKHF
jgi:iron complex outermembrane receptor protein